MDGVQLLALIGFLWFFVIMWKFIFKLLKFIFKLLKFIFKSLLKFKKGYKWFLNLEGDNRNNGLFILAGFSLIFVILYFMGKFFKTIDQTTIPDSLLVILISTPVAWVLWAWRNKDKHIDITNNELVADINAFLKYTEIIANKENDFSIRIAAMYGLEPYILGRKGELFFEQSTAFGSNFWNKQQHLFFDYDVSENIGIKELTGTFIKLIVLSIKTPSNFKKFFSRFDLSKIEIQVATCECDFTICMFFEAEFDHVTFRDVMFFKCYFHNSRFLACKFENCEFRECVFEEGVFTDVSFIDCTFTKVVWLSLEFAGQFKENNTRVNGSCAYKNNKTGLISGEEALQSFLDQFKASFSARTVMLQQVAAVPNLQKWATHFRQSD